jgi:cytochrome c551/c552
MNSKTTLESARLRSGTVSVCLIITLSWWLGCSNEQPAGAPTGGAAAPMQGSAQPSAAASGATPNTVATSPAGVGQPGDGSAQQQPGGAAMAPGASTPGQAAGQALPQDICHVLQQNGCVTCHQAALQGGAPMSLQWQKDFTGLAKDGTDMGSKLLARVTDASAPMPPQSTQRPLMPATDVDVLRGWVSAGVAGVDGTACEEAKEPTLEGFPAWATRDWPAEECEYVLTVGAHATSGTPLADDPAPYVPPEGETIYHCFYEKVPWGDKAVTALATRVHVDSDDDKAIVHHTVLSALGPNDQPSVLGGMRPTAAGQHHDCPNPSGSTVAVWAPGPFSSATYPEEVGVMMPSGAEAYIELQVHYNNVTAARNSRVSFDICATSKPQTNTAAVHWLGYENALETVPLDALGDDLQPRLDNQGNGVAVGTCSVKERARIMWMAPHMHEKGRHALIELVHADGMTEVLHDAPFSFTDQTAFYFDNLWVEKGDKIRSTCTWENDKPIVFGFGSSDEMCFFYTLAYPVGALKGEGDEFGVVGGNLSCAGSM